MTDDEPLLRGFTISQVMECLSDPTKDRIIAELWDKVDDVFPYLNAVSRNLLYNPGANTVTILRDGRILTFYPHVAVMAKVDGTEDAEAQLRWFQDLCNDTWRRRGEITPSYQRRQRLGLLDVYRFLPKVNCRACGELTCIAFSLRLLCGELGVDACPHLADPEYVEDRRRLEELMA